MGRGSELDPRWIAGFFDGEGCITAATQSGHRLPSLRVTQKKRWVLDLLRERYGGYVFIRKSTGVYNIQFLRGSAKRLLCDIAPYLVLKREQAELALRALEGGSKEEREELCAKIQELNHE
jgi:hypothetical protein